MKTIEEKAKAYDEALEDMRVIYPNLKGDAKLAVEHAFPQLRESEDERIRKEIISALKFANDGGVYDKHIAYLEKQEQKPTPDWMPKFLDELRSKKHNFDWDEHREIEGHILAIINWIAPNYFKEKEQKPRWEINNPHTTKWTKEMIDEKFEELVEPKPG